MQTNSKVAGNIDEYIEQFPGNVQAILQKLRATIKKTAPSAEETISYQMPAFKYHGMLVYFAGYKNHIGFYPTPSGTEKFRQELSVYAGAKGSVRFPLSQPIPYALIEQIVAFRVSENATKAAAKPKSNGKTQ